MCVRVRACVAVCACHTLVSVQVQSYCDQTCVALAPLPSFDHVADGDDAAAEDYCAALRALTADLGPMFLVKFGEDVNVVTNEL